MKKLLPIAAVAALAMPAYAAQGNYEYADFAAYAVSPDGRYVVSQLDGGVLIVRDMENNTQEIYTPDFSNEAASYSVGTGNCVSNSGMVVGSSESGPCLFIKGEVLPLPVKEASFISLANGVTPDGNVICGTLGLSGMSMDADSQMCAPCIWVRDEEGNYQGPVTLPHPDRDFSGRIPQYVTSVAISNDGKTIAGQIRDYSGWVEQPIVYTCDANGDWQYSLIGEDLINPNHVVFPEYPGDGPMMPAAEDYLGEAEKAAFEQAIADWQRECDESGYIDYNKYPDAENFLSAEQKEAYDKAMEYFAGFYPQWEEAYLKFMTVFEDCMTNGCQFIFNSVFLSPDGKRYLTTSDAKKVPEGGGDIPVPFSAAPSRVAMESKPAMLYICELDNNNSWTELTADSDLLATGISSDYTVFGSYNYSILPQAYVFKPGEKEGMMLETWMKSVNESTAEWMEDNMVFDVLAWDADLMQEITLTDVMCSGFPRIDQDVTLVACNSINLWDYNDASYYYTFFLYTGRDNGVAEIGAGDAALQISVEGNTVLVEGDVAETAVYAIDGSLVAKGISSVTLPSGVYVVRATASDGRVETLKTVVR